jgi:hypothetical protein
MKKTSTQKIIIALVLLLVAIGFWMWSQGYLNEVVQKRSVQQRSTQQIIPLSDEELNKQVDLTLDQSIELEIKDIEKEF